MEEIKVKCDNSDVSKSVCPPSSKWGLPIKRQYILNRYPELLFTCVESTPEIYKCDRCDFQTYLMVDLKHHIKVTHKMIKTEPQTFSFRVCKMCHFSTSSLLVLMKHKCKFLENYDINWVKHTIENWFQCEQCQYKTPYRHCLRKHKTAKHTADQDINWFKCDQCLFKTKFNYGLRKHKLCHDKEKSGCFKCEECNYVAETKKNLKYHVMAEHRTPFMYECEYCSYRTIVRKLYNGHVVAKHTPHNKISWFKCEQCPFRTKRKDTLKQHVINRHSTVKLTPKCY